MVSPLKNGTQTILNYKLWPNWCFKRLEEIHFFLEQFPQHLHENSLIHCSMVWWEWNLTQILEETAASEHVVDFVN